MKRCGRSSLRLLGVILRRRRRSRGCGVSRWLGLRVIGSVARVLLALILLRGSMSQAITVCRTLVAVWERLPRALPPFLPITLLLALLLPPPPPSVRR